MSLCPMRNSISKKECVGAECAWWVFDERKNGVEGCSVSIIAENLLKPIIFNKPAGGEEVDD